MSELSAPAVRRLQSDNGKRSRTIEPPFCLDFCCNFLPIFFWADFLSLFFWPKLNSTDGFSKHEPVVWRVAACGGRVRTVNVLNGLKRALHFFGNFFHARACGFVQKYAILISSLEVAIIVKLVRFVLSGSAHYRIRCIPGEYSIRRSSPSLFERERNSKTQTRIQFQS